jgi:Methylase involved in ubiquinone/menaquinone biosynthesis
LNAQCPFCLSLERQRLIWTYLKSNLNRNSDRPVKLLHVAPEPALTRLITERKGIEYLSIDIDSKKAMMAMDLTDLSFDDDSYDIIICSHVLEHIDDDRKALQELYRVLKAGGYAILQVPIDKNRAVTYENREITAPEERKKHFGQADHVRQYGLDFGERLEQAGFTVKIVTASEFTDNPERYGFNEDGLYVCYKKANERK